MLKPYCDMCGKPAPGCKGMNETVVRLRGKKASVQVDVWWKLTQWCETASTVSQLCPRCKKTLLAKAARAIAK